MYLESKGGGLSPDYTKYINLLFVHTEDTNTTGRGRVLECSTRRQKAENF